MSWAANGEACFLLRISGCSLGETAEVVELNLILAGCAGVAVVGNGIAFGDEEDVVAVTAGHYGSAVTDKGINLAATEKGIGEGFGVGGVCAVGVTCDETHCLGALAAVD